METFPKAWEQVIQIKAHISTTLLFIALNHVTPVLSFILSYLTAFKPIELYHEAANTVKE